MIPVRLSQAWSRRLYIALFIIAAIFVTLFALQYFKIIAIPPQLRVTLIPGVVAALALVATSVFFFFDKKGDSFIPSFGVYLLATVAAAITIQQTGGVLSLFLPIWSIIALLAALFGAYGWLPVLVLTGTFASASYLSGTLTTEAITTIVISSLAPLITGIIVWHNASTSDNEPRQHDVKNLANQLSEVATKSEIVINAIGDGVIAVDGQGVIQLINPAAQEILGWGKQDAMMLNYKSILKMTNEANKELGPSEDPILQVLNTNQQARGNKIVALTQSGKKVGISLVVSPIGDPGAGAIAVFRDTTKERAEEREQAEFISTASHEMRTPVASIEGYLGLAMNPNTATVDQRAHDFIQKAHEAAQHLGRLFQDLLDVSKSEDGRMTNIPKVVDLVPFAETIVQGLQVKATQKGLTLTFLPTQGGTSAQRKIMPVYFVNQDNDHIREILNNLVENAIKYTPKGSVVVDVTGTEDHVVISVKDSGLGIPSEDVSHLFQKFYRVENMDRQEIGGTGLGLYLSRRLAEAMQGRLWVESVYQQGSTFYLELPRISSMEAEALKSQQASQFATTGQTPAVAPAPAFVPEPVAPVVAQTPAPAPAPVPPMPQPAPVATPQVIPQQAVVAPPAQPQPIAQPAPAPTATTGVRPATTVPRGETLSREQIAERVKQLEQLAQQQRAAAGPPR